MTEKQGNNQGTTSVTTALKLALGRLLGSGKRKEPDIVSEWQSLCHANGETPTDRLLALLAWDLQQGGVDIAAIKATLGDVEVAKEQAELVKLKNEMSMLSELRALLVRQEKEHLEEMIELKKSYTGEVKQPPNELLRPTTKKPLQRFGGIG